MSSTDSPPPTPSVQLAGEGLQPYLDVGEVVTAVVVGGVERGGIHVACTNLGVWLTGQSWKPMHKVPSFELTAISRVEGGVVIEVGSERLPVRVWDDAAADKLVEAAAVWLEDDD